MFFSWGSSPEEFFFPSRTKRWLNPWHRYVYKKKRRKNASSKFGLRKLVFQKRKKKKSYLCRAACVFFRAVFRGFRPSVDYLICYLVTPGRIFYGFTPVSLPVDAVGLLWNGPGVEGKQFITSCFRESRQPGDPLVVLHVAHAS